MNGISVSFPFGWPNNCAELIETVTGFSYFHFIAIFFLYFFSFFLCFFQNMQFSLFFYTNGLEYNDHSTEAEKWFSLLTVYMILLLLLCFFFFFLFWLQILLFLFLFIFTHWRLCFFNSIVNTIVRRVYSIRIKIGLKTCAWNSFELLRLEKFK